MNKMKTYITLMVIIIGQLQPVFAQGKVYKVGIFAPLYLDSAFNSNNVLKYDRALPKQSIAGLEFIEGALIALDSLSANKPVEAFIYDVRSASNPLNSLVKNKSIDNLDLIIGSVRDFDFKMLADFALQKNIPFISATYPNDGGVTANPFLVILNSTLKEHCEGIFNYILQQHGTERVLLVKRKGDDRIFNYFKNLNTQEGKPLMKIETMAVDSFVYASSLKNHLDSNFKTVIIGASLDESLAKSLANAAFGIKGHYPLTLIGMPNWEGFKSFSGKDNFKDFPILYTSPYYIQKGMFDNYLSKEYYRLYKSRPTDFVYKGYEATYFFTHLLLNHPADLTSQLNDKTLTVFHEFNFKPVYINKKNGLPDYFENSHLFIMKLQNGVTSREW
ncbi:MAG: hypothetical protein NVSMB45_04610 [Ginsengibacter sp.]